MPQRQQATAMDVLVGSRIRMRRNEIGVRQQELADALGLSYQQVQKYEKGLNRIGASRLGEIAEILKVDVSFFFDRPETPAEEPGFDANAFLADRDGFLLARSFMSIGDAALRKSLVQLAVGIAAQSARIRAAEGGDAD